MTTENHGNANGARPRVALVVQRCGAEVNGGAEALCLQVAQNMASRWRTEVLTTCALDYVTWRNHYPPGEEICGDTTIRRFPVAVERDNEAFNRLSANLHPRQRLCSMAEQEEWMRAQGPTSPALTAFIRENREQYDGFIFFGYLYATTFDNLPLVAEKAWLAPLAHDEWPLYFTLFDRLFGRIRGYVFATVAERDLLRRRFFHLDIVGPVTGVGIEPPEDVRPNRFRAKHALRGRFLLYCGRVDPSKGCPEMFAAFLRWKRESRLPHQLVVLGKAVMPVPPDPDIVALGFVSEADKWDAMAGCDWLLVPSMYESLSIVLLETWAVGRPALVNAESPVLVEHCRRSSGGLAFRDWDEAGAAIAICTEEETARLGRSGQDYVAENYTWDQVCAKYEALLPGTRASADLPVPAIPSRRAQRFVRRITAEEQKQRYSIAELIRAADSYFDGIESNTSVRRKPFDHLNNAVVLSALVAAIQGSGLRPGDTVVDFGCGTGWLSRIFAFYGCKVVALDVSVKALTIGQDLMASDPLVPPDSIRFVLFGGENIPLADQSVDRIFSNAAFHHVWSQEKVLAEFLRVLKPGGAVSFQEPGPMHSEYPQTQMEMREYRVIEDNIVIEDIEKMALRLGFERMVVALFFPVAEFVPVREFNQFMQQRLPAELMQPMFVRATDHFENLRVFVLKKPGDMPLDSRINSGGLRCALQVEPRLPSDTLSPEIEYAVSIRNSGEAIWLPSGGGTGAVNLGVHLFSGETLSERNYFRSAISTGPVNPGQEIELVVRVPRPKVAEPRMIFDLVSEGVVWFEEMAGNLPVSIQST